MTLQNTSETMFASSTNTDATTTTKPMKKRTRCLRADEAGKWNEHFRALMEFKMKHNHCIVPHTYSEDPGLGRWVKRQRYQYKCLQQNKKSSMMPERVKMLEKIGFVWDPHEATWKENLEELIKFKKINGNCDVPYYFKLNPQLATWVTRQRRQYTLYNQGKNSSMTPKRISTLENLGFKWNTRVVSKFNEPVVSEDLKIQNQGQSSEFVRSQEIDMKMNFKMDMSSWPTDQTMFHSKIFSSRKDIGDRLPLSIAEMPITEPGCSKFTNEDGKMLLQVLEDFDSDSESQSTELQAPTKRARANDNNDSFNLHEDILSSVLCDLSDDE